jgi:competence protein ComEC
LRVTFLSLDRGAATLVQAPGGLVGLVGAGGPGDAGAIVGWLGRHHISKVDVLVATTWSEPYLGGAAGLLKRVKVGRIVRNPLYVPTPVGDHLLEDADRRGIKSFSPPPGDSETLFYTPPCEMRAVAPTGPMLVQFAKDPRCSAIFQFKYEQASILCLGDSSRKHQQVMWEQVERKPWGHVLQIGRNGAADSLLPSMLRPLRTRYAVIPIPRRSGARPAAGTLAALKQAGVRVYRTDRQGAVTVVTDGTQIHVTSER